MRVFIIFSTFLLTFAQLELRASHAAGADLTYHHVSGNNYEFVYSFYRFCDAGNTNASEPLGVYAYINAPSCGISNFQFLLTKDPGSVDITPLCQSVQSSCNGGPYVGYQKFTYRAQIQLTSPCPDYVITACHYARNGNINTVVTPNQENLCVQTSLDLSSGIPNNSPQFSFDPVSFICLGQTTCVNSGATDVDGDSLAFELINPLSAAFSNTHSSSVYDALGNYIGYYMGSPPPTYNISYLPGWSFTNPITGTTTFNQVNGDLCFTPTQNETSVIAVRVKEYRNGVLIGSVIRDMQVIVLANCNNQNPEIGDIHGGNTLNSDTLVCPDVALNIAIPVSDPNGNNVTISYNNTIPGSFVSVIGNNSPSATVHFAWTPLASQVSATPYCFTVSTVDDHCPYFGSSTRTYCIYLQKPTVNVNAAGPLCGNASAFNMVGSPSTNGTWNWSGTGITDPLLGTFDPSVAGQGSHWVVYNYTDNAGCTNSDSTQISINGSPVADAGLDSSICASGSVNLKLGGSPTGSWGTGPYTFSWTPASYLWNAAVPDPTVITNVDTSFIVVVTDALGCQDQDTVDISFFAQPSADAGIDLTYCSGNFVQDTVGGVPTASGGSGPYVYSWTPSHWVSDDSIANPFILGGNVGTLTLVVTDSNGCEDIDSITIDYNQSPRADAGPDIESCGLFTDTLGGLPTASGGTGPYTYEWLPALGLDDSSLANPNLNLSADTFYVVKITDAKGCTAIDTLFTSFGSVTADFDMIPESYFAPVNVYFDNNSSGATDYEWDFGDGDDSDDKDPTHLYNGSGSYVVQLIAYDDKTGCSDTLRKVLVLEGHSQIYVPNIITPNGDGENDHFKVISRNLVKFRCVIFNRWGTELYKFNEQENNWDGYTYSGKKVSNGTYFYLITAKGADDSEYNFKGTFSVLGTN
ncbi:MAG: gliding motility-associated C-terminal domain-containing protein [Flavobacteriales bacterium]|nr:gliding motility-associated C-terminal domain-containing protein [Flavobacteriales bacterium]